MKRGDQKIFRLTKEQFKEWDIFCTEHGKEMYMNKDSYSVEHMPESNTYDILINLNEQSGISNFLVNLTTQTT